MNPTLFVASHEIEQQLELDLEHCGLNHDGRPAGSGPYRYFDEIPSTAAEGRGLPQLQLTR